MGKRLRALRVHQPEPEVPAEPAVFPSVDELVKLSSDVNANLKPAPPDKKTKTFRKNYPLRRKR